MKKLILGIAAVAMFSTVSAQKNRTHTMYPETTSIAGKTGFYVDVHGGYNLPIAGQPIMENYDYTGADDTYDDVMGSFGKGANVGIAAGYMLSPNFGAELGFNYLLGSKYESTGRTNLTTYNQTMKGNMFQLSPSIVLKTNTVGKMNHYVKAGLLVGLGAKVTEEIEIRSGVNSAYGVREYTGNASLGITGAVGTEFAVNNNMAFFIEAKGNGLTYKPEKSEVVQATLNGQDQLQYLTVRDKNTVYLDSYTDNATVNEPNRASRISMPFSSIGVNVGMRFKF